MKQPVFIISLLLASVFVRAEDGYDLWLRYKPVENKSLLLSYRQSITAIHCRDTSPTLSAALHELNNGLKGLLNINAIPYTTGVQKNGTLVIGTAPSLANLHQVSAALLQQAGTEGFIILSQKVKGKNCIFITANSDIGVLYGTFHFLRLLQTGQPINALQIVSSPRIKLRMLNHWDNPDRYVERGYAGISIWNWHTLPGYIDQRYIDYARANASVGINGTVLTNVNANAYVLTRPWLEKVAALANVFRPYGIRVYLTARFSAPVEIGRLSTADPLNDSVQQWWSEKIKEIYQLIPDFGGFLVKANSEGEPGPQNYGRTHAEGANMLAGALAPYNGIVMWRAFVYSQQSSDRFKQAYDEFNPLDEKFLGNVLVQVKNGPIDFQPREPFSPLFGAMPNTPLMMEFQLTQEYLGQATHLVYEAPMFKEVLQSDTYAKGHGSTVAGIIDGSVHNKKVTGMAGVANIGNERNWTGHLFGQANWYSLGRLAWDHQLSSEQIADEWIKQTFNHHRQLISVVKNIMLSSHTTMVNYMTPLGLHHIMGNGHHYGPAPWSDNLPRPDWNPVYYHRADSFGIGFDRTPQGSNALAQYHPRVRDQYQDINTCDENYLLWFHHASWKHRMRSGRTLWEELCLRYYSGVDTVKAYSKQWIALKKLIDPERFAHVEMLLIIQFEEAKWWRDACLLYFQTFSKMNLPPGREKPRHTLEYYKQLRFPYAPGN